MKNGEVTGSDRCPVRGAHSGWEYIRLLHLNFPYFSESKPSFPCISRSPETGSSYVFGMPCDVVPLDRSSSLMPHIMMLYRPIHVRHSNSLPFFQQCVSPPTVRGLGWPPTASRRERYPSAPYALATPALRLAPGSYCIGSKQERRGELVISPDRIYANINLCIHLSIRVRSQIGTVNIPTQPEKCVETLTD